MTNTYYAITIGPVIETLSAAKKTRELWAASYFISYIIREISEQLSSSLGENGLVLLPKGTYPEGVNLLGAGLYPDRIYVKAFSQNGFNVQEHINKTFKNVIEQTSKKIYDDLNKISGELVGKEGQYISPFTYHDCLQCLLRYWKLYSAEVKIEDGENIIELLSSTADTLDLQPRILPYESKKSKDNNDAFTVDNDNRNPMQRLFYLANWSFLFEDGFGVQATEIKPNEPRKYTISAKEVLSRDNKTSQLIKLINEKPKRGFDSLIEVATRELRHYKKEIYDKIIDKEIKNAYNNRKDDIAEDAAEEAIISNFRQKFGKKFKDYHKYIVIVHADGDNIGKIVKAVGSKATDIPGFSEALTHFAQYATEEVVRFGGAPVYMGGDDMLFFAPVCNRSIIDASTRFSIFDLIKNLDETFNNKISQKFSEQIDSYYKLNNIPLIERTYPSLSYGISITFHKFPLYEAKSMSFDLLYEIKNEYKDKNAVNVKLMKHSGQTLPFLVPKTIKNGVNLWETFSKLVKSNNSSADFLNSFTYKISTLKPLISHCAKKGVERLNNLFKNSFNENYNSNKIFYDNLSEFIADLYKYEGKLDAKEFQVLYSSLRFIHFIHDKV